jgi:hypothetical protein
MKNSYVMTGAVNAFNQSFILFSIYPSTGTTLGCGNSHNVMYNASVKNTGVK